METLTKSTFHGFLSFTSAAERRSSTSRRNIPTVQKKHEVRRSPDNCLLYISHNLARWYTCSNVLIFSRIYFQVNCSLIVFRDGVIIMNATSIHISQHFSNKYVSKQTCAYAFKSPYQDMPPSLLL